MKKILKTAMAAFFGLSLIFTDCNVDPVIPEETGTGTETSEKTGTDTKETASETTETTEQTSGSTEKESEETTGTNTGTDTENKTPGTEDNGTEDKTSETTGTEDTDTDTTTYLVRSTNYTAFDDSTYESLTALEFSKIMGNGINLGNTMEASNNGYLTYNNADASKYETAWGQPVTKKAIFEAYKAAGFDCVRIPIAWTNTMDWSRGDFTINQNYLERVGDVVDMALDSGLIVMINDHWDYQWWGLFSHNEELAWKIYNAIWNQVGNYFKNYDYRLIFEGGNEELGERFNDIVDTTVDARLDSSVANYSTKGTLTTAQCYAMNTKVNQKFVDIVRGQGSKNAKRFLLIPGYDTDFDKTCSSSYVMPEDSTNTTNKLFVSVHYYLPSTYAIVSDPANSWGYSDSWGTADDITTQNSYFYEMQKFTKAGYGVMIGEYGCALANNKTRKSGDVQWITNILDNCDTCNYVPFMWDCNGYFKKTGTLGFADSDVAAIYDGRNYEAEKAGTSDGGTIEYGITTVYSADSATLKISGENVTKTFTLSEAVSVSSGKTITLKFERPAITRENAQHRLDIKDSSGNLVHGTDTTWCTAATYPGASVTTNSISFTATSDCTIKSFTLTIWSPDGADSSGNAISPASEMTISNISLTVK